MKAPRLAGHHGAASGIAVATVLWRSRRWAAVDPRTRSFWGRSAPRTATTRTGLRRCRQPREHQLMLSLPSAISTTPVTVGLYVPSSTTGTQTVQAQAVGSACGNVIGQHTVPASGPPARPSPARSPMIDAHDLSADERSTGTGDKAGRAEHGVRRRRHPRRDASLRLLHRVRPGHAPSSAVRRRRRPTSRSTRWPSLRRQDLRLGARASAGNNVKVWSFDGHIADAETVLAERWLVEPGLLRGRIAPGRGRERRGRPLEHQQLDPRRPRVLGSSNFFVGALSRPTRRTSSRSTRTAGATSARSTCSTSTPRPARFRSRP